MIRSYFDELVGFISGDGGEQDLAMAKKRFFHSAGGLFGDEDSFDERIGAFLEWYVFDRRIGGRTKLELYAQSLEDIKKREEILDLGGSIRSIFKILKVTGPGTAGGGLFSRHRIPIKNEFGGLYLKDLKDRKKYLTLSMHRLDGFKRGDIMETRLLPHKNMIFLSNYHIFHPREAKKYIKKRLKKIDASNTTGNVITELSNMSLKWERFRNYKVSDIYKD